MSQEIFVKRFLDEYPVYCWQSETINIDVYVYAWFLWSMLNVSISIANERGSFFFLSWDFHLITSMMLWLRAWRALISSTVFSPSLSNCHSMRCLRQKFAFSECICIEIIRCCCHASDRNKKKTMMMMMIMMWKRNQEDIMKTCSMLVLSFC